MDFVQLMKHNITWLEASNMNLHKELVEACGQFDSLFQNVVQS
jgi:hypothetical protein